MIVRPRSTMPLQQAASKGDADTSYCSRRAPARSLSMLNQRARSPGISELGFAPGSAINVVAGSFLARRPSAARACRSNDTAEAGESDMIGE